MYVIVRNLLLLILASLMLNISAQGVEVTPPVGDRCSEMFNYKGEVYVCADHPVYGKELHRINGGRYSTVVVKDIDPGPGGSGPRAFFESNGWLYFFAETTLTGYALWRTDGTDVGTKLIRSVFGYTPIRVVASVNDDFFIIAHSNDNSPDHSNLIRSNGAYAGTSLIEADVRPYPYGSSIFPTANASSYIVLNGYLYFLTDQKLYKVADDNTVSTVADGIPVDNLHRANYIASKLMNGNIVIAADNEIWLSNGTTDKTFPTVKAKGGVEISGIQVIDNQMLYVTDDSTRDFRQMSKLIGTNGDNSTELYSGKRIYFRGSSSGRLFYEVDIHDFRHVEYVFTGGTAQSTRSAIFFQPGSRTVEYAELIYLEERGIGVTKVDPVTGIKENLAFGNEGVDLTIVGADSRGVVIQFRNRFTTINQLELLEPSGARIQLGLSPGSAYWHKEGGRYYTAKYSINTQNRNVGIWHSNASVDSTYRLYYRYDNGEPEDENDGKGYITPILDLLFEEEKKTAPRDNN